MDFVNNLDTDTSISILSCLDDPSDLVRASSVSRSWRHFLIRYSFSKNLCLKLFHQLSNVNHVIETSNTNEEEEEEEEEEEAGPSNYIGDDDDRRLEIEHRAYALLAHRCTMSPIRSCIVDAIKASSTDNYPSESILNTLEEREEIDTVPFYWSSKGQSKTCVPESLLYKLRGDLCVVNEFSVQPFKASFQDGMPIYSSQYVRIRLGYRNNSYKKGDSDSNFVWTYTSQEFPMAQENRLQSFKLPKPVLCIGGYMLVEFLGRVQTQEVDGLYYICITHVKAMGRSMAKSFRVVNPNKSGKFGLKVRYNVDEMETEEEQSPVRNLHRLLHFLHGQPLDIEYIWPDSDNEDAESDDEDVELDNDEV
ncbi:unnamed protein product [Cochlearia groenlandica]